MVSGADAVISWSGVPHWCQELGGGGVCAVPEDLSCQKSTGVDNSER